MARTQADKDPAAASDANEGRVTAAAGKGWAWGRLYCLGNREPAAQVLEGEMSAGGCLFSLAGLEAAGDPLSAALKAASEAPACPPVAKGALLSALGAV